MKLNVAARGAPVIDVVVPLRMVLSMEGITCRRLCNPHPGEILKKEFLSAIGMSQNQLAHSIGAGQSHPHHR